MHHFRHRSPARASKPARARHLLMVLLAATVIVAVAAPLSTHDESTVEAESAPAATRASALADAPRGMRIHLDEQGRPTTAPASTSREAVRSSSVTAPAPANLVELDTPRGGKMVVLDGRFQPYSVAHIRPDGTVAVGCDRSGDHGHSTGHSAAACSAADASDTSGHAGVSE